MKVQELEKPLEWSELGVEPIETIAQEARRVLSLIPEEAWSVGVFYDEKTGQACALGHFNKYQNDIYSDNFLLREASNRYLLTQAISMEDIATVNNGGCWGYSQPTPKQRVIALLDDMIKAGF